MHCRMRTRSRWCRPTAGAAVLGALLICCAVAAEQPAGQSGYSNDFEKAEAGKVPEDFLVLSGQFAVKPDEQAGGQYLEVPGEPLDGYGLLFGPGEEIAVDVGARIWGDASGRRAPEFGVGCHDTGGYKLWLMPARKQLAIRRNDEPVAHVAYEAWEPGTWTAFRLRVRPAGENKWVVEGKAWPAGGEEPAEWMVTFEETEQPSPGRSSVWGNP